MTNLAGMTDAGKAEPGITLLDFGKALLDPKLPPPDGVGKHGKGDLKRFSVYRNNVIVSLLDGMRQAYPSLLAIMGADNFARVARVYISASPPWTPVMQDLGSGFAAFLEDFPPLARSRFLADVARAERAWLDAWHEQDCPPLTASDLSILDPEAASSLVLEPHTAARLIPSEYPLYDLFNARLTWPCPGIDLTSSQPVLITRPDFTCRVTRLDAGQYAFFDSAFRKTSLAEAIDAGQSSGHSFDPSSAIAIALESGAFRKLSAQAQSSPVNHTKPI